MAGRKLRDVVLLIGIIGLLGCAAHRDKAGKSELETIEEWPPVAKEEIAYPGKGASKQTGLSALKEKVKEYIPVKKSESPKTKKPSHIAPAKDIQTALKNAGYDPGKIDGKIGPKTTSAIKAFQKYNGLKDDGIVGQRTWNLLSKYLASSVSTTAPVSISMPASGITVAEPWLAGRQASTVSITESPPTITTTSEEDVPGEMSLVMEEVPQEKRNFTPVIVVAIIILAILLAVSIYRRRAH